MSTRLPTKQPNWGRRGDRPGRGDGDGNESPGTATGTLHFSRPTAVGSRAFQGGPERRTGTQKERRGQGIPTELALGVRRRGRERTRYSTYFLAKGSVLHALPFQRDAHPQSPRSFRRGPGKQPRSAARTPLRALAWTRSRTPRAFSRATCKFRSLPPSHALRKLPTPQRTGISGEESDA